jgi:tryptophan-rich sensory protein
MLNVILMTISLIAVVVVDVAANIVPFNGSTTGEIANKLPVLFTPASYVLIIWPALYVLLAFWLYGYFRSIGNNTKPLRNRRAFLFILSCLLNITWIVLWHYEFFIWTIIILASLLTTLLTLYFTYPKKENLFFERIPIAFYLGWIFIAFIVDVSYVLTLHEWKGWGLSDPLWTVIYLTVATAIALHFIYHHLDFVLNLVFMWAFIGITVKNGFDELFVSAAALFLTAVIGVGILLARKSTNVNE